MKIIQMSDSILKELYKIIITDEKAYSLNVTVQIDNFVKQNSLKNREQFFLILQYLSLAGLILGDYVKHDKSDQTIKLSAQAIQRIENSIQ